MLGVIIAIVVGLLLVCWSLYTIYLEYIHRLYAHIPHPEPFNFYLGNIRMVVEVSGRQQRPIDSLLIKWQEQCGPLFVIFFLHKPLIITMNPKDCKFLLMSSKAYKSPEIYEAVACPLGSRFVGYGIATEPYYNKWIGPRRHFDPCFSKTYLKPLIPQINVCVNKLVERIDACADGKTPIPITTQFGITTLDVISQMMASTDALGIMKQAPSLKGKNVIEWVKSLHDCFDAVETTLYPHGIVYSYLRPFKTKYYKDSVLMNRKLAQSCLDHRMRALERGEAVPHDLLERIMQRTTTNGSENKLTFEDLVDDFVTFFVAGFETTTVVLGFTLALMLKHPSVLARVQEEVAEVLDDREEVTAEDVEKMGYMQQVIDESLRLYPPAYGTQRKFAEDIELSGYNIPKNTGIHVSLYGMVRLPSNFEDPERFDPSRFDHRNSRPDPFIYLPFARGHRTCIGRILATFEVKIILARLLQKFHFQLPDNYEVDVEAHLTLRLRTPLNLTAERV